MHWFRESLDLAFLMAELETTLILVETLSGLTNREGGDVVGRAVPIVHLLPRQLSHLSFSHGLQHLVHVPLMCPHLAHVPLHGLLYPLRLSSVLNHPAHALLPGVLSRNGPRDRVDVHLSLDTCHYLLLLWRQPPPSERAVSAALALLAHGRGCSPQLVQLVKFLAALNVVHSHLGAGVGLGLLEHVRCC